MLKSLLLVTVLRLERNCTHHIFTNLRERRCNGSRIVENTNCINAILFNYVYYIVFVKYMHFICIYYSFSKASGAHVGVCPVHNHRVYRFLQACNYLMKKSI